MDLYAVYSRSEDGDLICRRYQADSGYEIVERDR